MSTFPLRIGTPDGLLYEGNVERVVCRSISGDLAILARHCNFCTALGMGEASVVMEDGTSRLLATTWEWKEDIDAERAKNAKQRAEAMMAKGGLTDNEYKIAEAKLQRALVRLSVKQ